MKKKLFLRFSFFLIGGVLILVVALPFEKDNESKKGTNVSHFEVDKNTEWYNKAAGLLSKAGFTYPGKAEDLWNESDGLPEPNDIQFAQKAVKFIPDHPIPLPEERIIMTTSTQDLPYLASGQSLEGTGAVWDVPNIASRQCKCLAYLANGGREAKQEVGYLCILQAMQLQWMLPIRNLYDETFYAASASLGLTGFLLRQQAEKHSMLYEVGTQWLRMGLGRLDTYGGRGNKELQEVARMLILDAVDDPAVRDLHGKDEEFFMQLDLTRPDMREVARHVTAGNIEQAKQAYIETLARRFSAYKPVTPSEKEVASRMNGNNADSNEEIDLAEADDMCRNIFTITSHMYKRVDYCKDIDWSWIFDNDYESMVWMVHHPWMKRLLNAYYRTGDEKYVTHLCRLFNDWYAKCPVTFECTGKEWRTLAVGTRPGQAWYSVLCGLTDHPVFMRECLFNMARSALDHGKYLSMYGARGGNWLQVESSGLTSSALMFPEFKLSPLFYQIGSDRLAWVNTFYFLPDGFQSECTPGYHQYPIEGFPTILSLAKSLKIPPPHGLEKVYENAIEALMYIAYPNLTLPMLSDNGPYRGSARLNLARGEDIFGRKDFRWFISDGKEGTPPARTSYDFTTAGYCVMRDKWGPDGQVLIFDAGFFGGHAHDDKLNFVYYAGGRELIGDPGIYSYNVREFESYWRGSWGHNTITIDGLSQDRRLGPKEVIPDPDRRFVTGDGFDFATGWYKQAYSPRKSMLWSKGNSGDRAAAIWDVQHQRCVFCIKGEYAIICDRVLGKGEHQVDINFHPAPIVSTNGLEYVVRPVDLKIELDGVVITKESKHANVAIIPAQGESLETLDLVGQKDPCRGWYALYGVQPSHDIVYRSNQSLPVHFETVVQPLPAGHQTSAIKIKSLIVEHEERKDVAGIEYGKDLFLLSYDGTTKMKYDHIAFEGSALLLRHDSNGKVVQAQMIDGTYLSIKGKTVFSTDMPMSSHVLNFQ
ncbi:MAG: alginate lyase family protein [Mangrovibacterium sp.]